MGRVEGAVVGERSACPTRSRWVAAKHERGRGVERRHELAQFARRREVLVFLGDAYEVDAVARRELGDHGVDEILGRARSRGDTDDACRSDGVEIELLGT